MDRITQVTVTFSDGKSTKVVIYVLDPNGTFIKSNTPQGKVAGYLEVKGPVLKIQE